jgi:hypothetical protein
LRSIKIVLRACHELNSSAAWGDRTYRRAYNMTLLTTEEGYNYVRQAIGRYFSIFTDVFGNTWSSIPNDYAYGSSQLWPYWNTNRSHKGPFDLRITCPGEAKLIGPDYYDHWPAHLTEAIFNEAMVKTTKQGWPVGLLQWLNWGRSIGKPLALGEIGLMTRSFVNGGRPPYDGWDNPEYVRLMLEFCKQNAADIGFVSYFNRDVTASLALPAHLIKPWTGIDTGANCVRNPPGDNNQCGARAFKQWMAANA